MNAQRLADSLLKRVTWRRMFFVLLLSTTLSGCATSGGSLIKAAYEGRTADVTALLDQGEDVDQRGLCGRFDTGGGTDATPLFCAAHGGHLEVVKVLLKRGADVNARTGCTNGVGDRMPLTAAAYANHSGIAELLIAHGADVADAVAALEANNDRAGVRFLYRVAKKPPPATPPPLAAAQVIRADVDVPPPFKGRSDARRYAIVVGIEQYRQKLPKADFAARDAETVAAYLVGALGYPEENVVTLLDDHAGNVDLVKYFEKWLPNNVEPGATVFVYYSGHGAPNPRTGDAYLVPYDGDPAFIDETGYSLKRMYAALGKLPAREVVVALDSCFSGAGGRSVLAPGTRSITLNLKDQAVLPRNLTVLAASSGAQTSSTYAEKGHGLFTYFFLKGIKHEDVVTPDGALRLDELFAYLAPQVERVARKVYNNEQTPQLLAP